MVDQGCALEGLVDEKLHSGGQFLQNPKNRPCLARKGKTHYKPISTYLTYLIRESKEKRKVFSEVMQPATI